VQPASETSATGAVLGLAYYQRPNKIASFTKGDPATDTTFLMFDEGRRVQQTSPSE